MLLFLTCTYVVSHRWYFKTHSTLYCTGLANTGMNRFSLAYLHCPHIPLPAVMNIVLHSVGVRACIK